MKKWPKIPLSVIISELEGNPRYEKKILCDLGCGKGRLQKHFLFDKNDHSKGVKKLSKIYSFDLSSPEPFIQIADISNLPLANSSVDISVFCLALMGVNYIDYIEEALRITKIAGKLIIAEVNSRIPDFSLFHSFLSYIGLKLEKTVIFFLTKLEVNSYFTIWVFHHERFEKHKEKRIMKFATENSIKGNSKYEVANFVLHPWVYKKRENK